MEGILIGLIISVVLGGGSYYYIKNQFEPKAKEATDDKPELHKEKEVQKETKEEHPKKVYRKPTEEEIDNHQMVSEARSRAKEIIIEAKSKALQIKSSAEDEVRKIKDKATEFEKSTKPIVFKGTFYSCLWNKFFLFLFCISQS